MCECVVKSYKNKIYSDVWIIYDFVIGAITSYVLWVVFACHIVMFIHLQLLYDILTQPKSFDIVYDNNNANRSNRFRFEFHNLLCPVHMCLLGAKSSSQPFHAISMLEREASRICVCINIYIYIYIYTSTCICIYIHMYIYIYSYTLKI